MFGVGDLLEVEAVGRFEEQTPLDEQLFAVLGGELGSPVEHVPLPFGVDVGAVCRGKRRRGQGTRSL